HNAISFDENRKASIDVDKCVGCGRCIGACNFNAIAPIWNSANDDMNRKIAEYSYAVIKDKPNFHISLVIDVSPFCDCHWENDTAIIPDVGMFASFDPVALDVACADACNKQKPLENSLLGENLRKGGECCGDHFHATSPATNWRSCVEHAQKLGLGNMEYELIEVK
ncbi:MAG: DUF362 domain-containing protein, partial [Oscillospiraceae bacterium]